MDERLRSLRRQILSGDTTHLEEYLNLLRLSGCYAPQFGDWWFTQEFITNVMEMHGIPAWIWLRTDSQYFGYHTGPTDQLKKQLRELNYLTDFPEIIIDVERPHIDPGGFYHHPALRCCEAFRIGYNPIDCIYDITQTLWVVTRTVQTRNANTLKEAAEYVCSNILDLYTERVPSSIDWSYWWNQAQIGFWHS